MYYNCFVPDEKVIASSPDVSKVGEKGIIALKKASQRVAAESVYLPR